MSSSAGVIGEEMGIECTRVQVGSCTYMSCSFSEKRVEPAASADSKIGRLDQGLDEARKHDWTVVDMKRDWATVFAFESETGAGAKP